MIYTITLTADQLRILDEAMQNMPFKLASPLIAHVNSELQKPVNQIPPTGGIDAPKGT